MKGISKYLILALFLVPSINSAQGVIDSLRSALDSPISIEQRVDVLNSLAQSLLNSDLTAALQYGEQADSLLKISYDLKADGVNKNALSLIHQRLGNYERSIEVSEAGIRQLRDNMTAEGSIDGLMMIAQLNRNLGGIHRRQGNYSDALVYCQKAVDTYDSLISLYPSDKEILHNQSRTLMAIAIIHSSATNYKVSTTYYLRALAIAESSDLPVDATYVSFNLASELLNQQKYDSALIYLNQVRFLADSLDIDRLKPFIHQNLGVAYKETGRLEESELSIREALRMVKERGLTEQVGHLNGVLASVFLDMGRLREAERTIEEGMKYVDEDMLAMQSLLKTQWQLLEKQGRYRESLSVFKEFRALEDSAISLERDRRFTELEAKYQNEKKEKELAQNAQEILMLESENQERKMWGYGLAALLVIWVVFAWVIITSQRKRIRVARELDQAKTENAALREKELQQELELKNKELTSYTVNFIQKNELLEDLKEILDRLLSDKGIDTAGELRKLQRMIAQNANLDKYWEDFRVHFDNVHKDFFRDLKNKHPELTGNDLKLCALTKLNLNLKESSIILGISPESVKIARYRLRKKLKLEQEVPLMDYLFSYN